MHIEDRLFTKLVSPFDIRDYKLVCSVEAALPETFTLESVSVKNQGSTGSCVAHACSSIVEYHNKIQQKDDTVFSTEFIYGYRPAGYYVGAGMYLRDALKTLQKLGDCPLTKLRGNNEYKQAIENVNTKLDELKAFAYPNRISTYMRVYGENAIKQALMNHGYVLVSMPWHKDYKLKDGVYTYTSDEIRGYHAVVIYGWDERGWLVHNSWGSSWGQKGKFVVPFDFKWVESWCITDNIVNDDIVKPVEKWWVKLFGKLINFIVNIFKGIRKK